MKYVKENHDSGGGYGYVWRPRGSWVGLGPAKLLPHVTIAYMYENTVFSKLLLFLLSIPARLLSRSETGSTWIHLTVAPVFLLDNR